MDDFLSNGRFVPKSNRLFTLLFIFVLGNRIKIIIYILGSNRMEKIRTGNWTEVLVILSR